MDYLRWIAGLGLVSACGGSAPPPTPTLATSSPARAEATVEDVPAVHKRGSNKLIVVVGKQGGSLELDNGARLVIPPGALAESVEVTFAEGARTTAFSNHDYERPVGTTLDIACDAMVQTPLELSIPIPKLPDGFTEKDLALGVEAPATMQRAVQGQATQTRWDYLTAASSGTGRAVAQLAQVPGYRVQFLVSKNE